MLPATLATSCKVSKSTVLWMMRWLPSKIANMKTVKQLKNWHSLMMYKEHLKEKEISGISNIPLLGALYWRFHHVVNMQHFQKTESSIFNLWVSSKSANAFSQWNHRLVILLFMLLHRTKSTDTFQVFRVITRYNLLNSQPRIMQF